MKIRIPAAVLLLVSWGDPCSLGAPPQAGGETGVRQELVRTILGTGAGQQKELADLAESGSKLAHDVLTAWTRDEIYLVHPADGSNVPVLLEEQQDATGKARAIRIDSGQVFRDAQGRDLRFDPNALDTADTDMRLRGAIQQALDALTLADPDPDARRAAVVKLGNSRKMSYVPVLEGRRAKEADESVRKAIDEAVALLRLGDPDPKVRLGAIQDLSNLNSIGSLDNLRALAASAAAPPEVAHAAGEAVRALELHIERVNFFGTIFRGLSLGSILLVVALGLAITFGLMGVINMAHGEMIAVGAYTCYVVQNLFGTGFRFAITLPFAFSGKQLSFGLNLPGLNAGGWFYQSYFLFAIPLSFVAGALAGLVLERTVIRFLYRRPLESLLATWGVSLFMQQCFRMVFGSNNVNVDSPTWLLGHFSIHDVSFGYNRVFVIGFAVVIVLGTWLLLTFTPLGLLIRSVMQNRDMAACMGVRTNRVNMLTFAFGSGLAGLAGAFLSQIGNVGPSLGQNYIVDSFMVVVVGGVGSIVGTVCASLGIGTVDQVLQQLLESPVVGKITVLVAIILFLQWKPGGLFSTRTRSLD
jgi:urea transport system permease protein